MMAANLALRIPALMLLILLALVTGCGGWASGTIDYTRAEQIFEIPAHDPMVADQISRYYEIRQGGRVTRSRDYPKLPIDERTVVVEVWIHRYDTNGDGQFDLWRKESNFPAVTIVHPDGRRLIHPPHRRVFRFVGERQTDGPNRYVIRRQLLDEYDARGRLGADGVFEKQIVRPPDQLKPEDIETAL
jgi:hypothetical protein